MPERPGGLLALPSGLLALPAPGDRTVAALDRKLALLSLRALLTAPLSGFSTEVRRAILHLRPLLSALLRDAGPALVQATLSPEVLTPLLVWQAGAASPEALLRAAMPALLLGLAQLGAAREGLLWDLPIPQILVGDRLLSGPFDGLYVIHDRAELRVDGRFVRPGELPGPTALHALSPTLSLALTDPNPLAMVEDHPDKAGNALDLGGREPGVWVEALREALALVRLALPEWHAELSVSLRRLVPVGYEPERHLSASYREAPSQAYLTLHPDPLTLAEAIVHETQHGKLNRLLWFDAVLENGHSTWTSSPVRPDMRPLMGVLLAAHAFVPVAAMHARLAGHDLAAAARFAERRAEVREQNARALATLWEKGQLTPTGRGVMDALQALHAASAP